MKKNRVYYVHGEKNVSITFMGKIHVYCFHGGKTCLLRLWKKRVYYVYGRNVSITFVEKIRVYHVHGKIRVYYVHLGTCVYYFHGEKKDVSITFMDKPKRV